LYDVAMDEGRSDMPKKQWEVGAKDRFLRFLREQHGQPYVVTGEDVVTNSLTRRDFDYELTPNTPDLSVIALEIFRLVGDEQDLGHHRAWNDIVFRLTTELRARGIAGYLIRTPHFNIPKSKRKEFASETADRLAAAIASRPDQETFSVDGYVLYKLPGDAQVRFSYIGGVRQINPFGSVSDSLDELLPTKNEQLNTQGRLRTLLILNAGIFPQAKYDVRQYFSTKNLEEFPNIDRVFFEIAPGSISLVFDRRVFDCYRDERLTDDEDLAALFFPLVEHRLSFRDTKAFGIVRKIRERYGTLDRLSADGKDALISSGEMFVEEMEWPSVLWIIEQLKNDSHPPFPNPMHDQVAKGEDYRIITSVRGRLCWLIQKIVVHNLIEHYPSMLDILEGYAFGPDFYIRSQACVPLSEMAVRRRQKLPDGIRFMPEKIAERVKAIALRMLQNAGTNPALLDDVSNVLRWIGDLTEKEATEVIQRLSAVGELDGIHNRCGLLLYFALFRENQFPDLPPFDPARFKERLHEELRNGEPRFRTSLIWQMAGGAEEKTYPFEAMRPYLTSFVSGEYEDGAFLHLRRICGIHLKDHPEDLCPIILGALRKLADYIAAEPRSRGWNMYDLEDFFDVLLACGREDCVLDGVILMLSYKARIPGISGKELAAVLGRYQSARAEQLRERHRDALDA
jgi:hypothetical protein